MAAELRSWNIRGDDGKMYQSKNADGQEFDLMGGQSPAA